MTHKFKIVASVRAGYCGLSQSTRAFACMSKSSKRTGTKTGKLPRALVEPIAVKVYRRTLVGLKADEAKAKNEEEWARVGKLLLAKLVLATECFAGFRVQPAASPRPGRPAHNPMFLTGLLTDVDHKKRSMRAAGSEISDAKAVVALIRDPQFRQRWGRYKPRTLENVLSRARNPTINPLGSLWKLKGRAGKEARRGISKWILASRKPPP
jgi:hypothetical protein